MRKIYLQKNTGYTIIETLISVSVFLVVILYGMGSLLNANLLRQKSQDMRSIMDNLSFIMEDLSRNLRTGYTFYCIAGNDTLTNVAVPKSGQSCWGIAFESAYGNYNNNVDQWVYYVDNAGRLFKSTQGPYVAASFVQLTPDEVYIDPNPDSLFGVLGAESVATNQQQPLVTIRLSGQITFKNVITPFSLQTSVSQRLIDN